MRLKTSLRRIVGLIVVLALGLPLAAEGADGHIASPEAGWPQWRGSARNGISSETGLLAAWPAEGPKLLWRIDDLGRGWSTPIVTNGTVYVTGDVGNELVIYAIDLDGKLKWKTTNGRSWRGSYPGARATPVYSEGMLYHVNAYGQVVALEAATGKELWTVNVLERFDGRNITWAISECMVVDGNRLIITPGGTKGLMAALDKRDGQTIWTTVVEGDDRAAYTSPVLVRYGGRKVLIQCSSDHGFAVDAETGELLWKVPLRNLHRATVAMPVYGEGQVFFAAPDGPNGAVYRMSADATAVDLAWKTQVDTLTSSGIYLDGTLFASGCKNTKTLHALDWKTGRDRYSIMLADSRSPFAAVAMVWADGRLYCMVEEGTVAMLKPGPEGFEVLGKFKLVDAARAGDAWAHPVLLDGRLYLRYHGSLWCYEVR